MAAAPSMYTKRLRRMGIKDNDLRWLYMDRYEVWGATKAHAVLALRRHGFIEIDEGNLKMARAYYTTPVLSTTELKK